MGIRGFNLSQLSVKYAALWEVITISLANDHRHFGRAFCVYFYDRRDMGRTFLRNMGIDRQTTRHFISELRNLHDSETLRSR
jgi:hypothetical protein